MQTRYSNTYSVGNFLYEYDKSENALVEQIIYFKRNAKENIFTIEEGSVGLWGTGNNNFLLCINILHRLQFTSVWTKTKYQKNTHVHYIITHNKIIHNQFETALFLQNC